MKKKILALALVGAALLSGCASVPKDAGQNPDDPWESLNRQTFAFNQGLDFILIRPLAKGYQFITPKPVREGVTRVFQNTMEPSNAVNNVLQGKVEEGILSLFRLMINSTVGVVGIFDVAQMVDIPRMPEDFGQTLATWGVPKGPYFVIPVLGPSTVRDTVGLVPKSSWIRTPTWVRTGSYGRGGAPSSSTPESVCFRSRICWIRPSIRTSRHVMPICSSVKTRFRTVTVLQ